MPWHNITRNQKPTWIDPVTPGDKIVAQTIGLARGLFWQPAYIEVLPAKDEGQCLCCGFQDNKTYSVFNKDQFSYKIEGKWPHPHSPIVSVKNKDDIEEKFLSFGASTAPSWTQLSRFVVQQEIDDNNIAGHQPAPVVTQVRELYSQKSQRLHLLIGGYQNRGGQASVLGRRHEIFTLNHGWDRNRNAIRDFVNIGLGYKDALYNALKVFVLGRKSAKNKLKGLGERLRIHQIAEMDYYRKSEATIQDTLARMDFEHPQHELSQMSNSLKAIVEDIFDESVRPYRHDPELIMTLAKARKTLQINLRGLQPQKDGGGANAKIPTT